MANQTPNTKAFQILAAANSEAEILSQAYAKQEADFKEAVEDAALALPTVGVAEGRELAKMVRALDAKKAMLANATTPEVFLAMTSQVARDEKKVADFTKQIAELKANAKAHHAALEAQYNLLYTELPVVEAPVQA